MQWAWETYGDKVYTALPSLEKELLAWGEQGGLDLNAKNRKALVSGLLWQKQKELLAVADSLMGSIGTDIYDDFNHFTAKVDAVLKESRTKLTASERNSILSAVSWYDETAARVISKTVKLSGDTLDALCVRLSCTESQLPDYGYFPTGKKGEFTIFDSASDLRDSENIPLKENVYDYFLREVKPHVAEAWIDLEKTKIGYEISFNKYFYQHKPLRSLAEVADEILALEKENDGLIMDILGLGVQ
jgi:type I restriction enzyme M protein